MPRFRQRNFPSRPVLTTNLRAAAALLLAASLPAAPAWAGCGNAADFNASLSDNTAGGGPGNAATGTTSIDAGTVITWTIALTGGGPGGTVTIQPLISPGGVDNAVVKTGSVGGTVQFTASATGNYGFDIKLDGGAGTVSATLTASCGGGGGAGGGASDASSGTDAGVRTGDAGRLQGSLGNFPGFVRFDDDGRAADFAQIADSYLETENELKRMTGGSLPENVSFGPPPRRTVEQIDREISFVDSKIEEAETKLAEARSSLESLNRAQEELRIERDKKFRLRAANQGVREFEPLPPDLQSAKEAEAEASGLLAARTQREILDDFRAAAKTLDRLKARKINLLKEKLKRLARDRANLITNDNLQKSGLVVGVSSQSPVFVSSRSFATNGASNLWTRLKITSLNGTLGRGGLAVHGQVGLVWPTANGGSIGSFLSLFRASTSSSSLSTSNTATGLGVGGYYKFPLSGALTGGLSASYERSSNSTNNGTGTGTYLRDLATVDASVSTTRRQGLITWTPSANLSYTYSNRHAYTDSTATAIPARIDQALVASASLNGSRVFAARSPKVRLLTLSGGLTVSANLSGSDTIAFSSGATVTNSAWSASVNGGASWLMTNGGTLNLGANIGGIGNSVQSYSASVRYDIRF